MYNSTVAPVSLDELPLLPPETLGPFRDADYQALPDEPRCELLYGELVVTPAPSIPHQLALGQLSRLFQDFAASRRWVTLFAPFDVRLADHSVVQPDILLVDPARFVGAPRRLEGAPNLAVEIVSPSSGRRDRNWKLKLYAESRVPEYWIVDVPAKTIEFLVLGAAGRYEVGLPEAGVWRSAAAPGLEIDLPRFWADVDDVLSRLPIQFGPGYERSPRG
jgi:Uma2 family endonuclease